MTSLSSSEAGGRRQPFPEAGARIIQTRRRKAVGCRRALARLAGRRRGVVPATPRGYNLRGREPEGGPGHPP
jgi:hypothetical protein